MSYVNPPDNRMVPLIVWWDKPGCHPGSDALARMALQWAACPTSYITSSIERSSRAR